MKWDIDKALAILAPLGGRGVAILPDRVSTQELRRCGLKLKKEPEWLNVWRLSIGVPQAPSLVFYGRTIREAFLLAKKGIRKLKKNPALVVAGVVPATKPKRNSYNSARKKK